MFLLRLLVWVARVSVALGPVALGLVALGLFAAGLTGCQAVGSPAAGADATPAAAPAATVLVEDGMLLGRRLPVPSPGRAIDDIVATTLRPSIRLDPEFVNDYAVVLVRGSSQYFVPLQLVRNTAAGSIHALPGDRVNLVNFRPIKDADPGLAANPNQTVKILGLHESAGQDLPIFAGMDDVSALGGLRGTFPSGDGQITANIAVVTRVSGGSVENYVIPLTDFDLDLLGLASFKVHGGDVLSFTRLELLDLVRAGSRRALVTRDLVAQDAAGAAARSTAARYSRGAMSAHHQPQGSGHHQAPGNPPGLLERSPFDFQEMSRSFRARLPW